MQVPNSRKMNGGVPHYSSLRSSSVPRRLPFHRRFRRYLWRTYRICLVHMKHAVLWRDLPILLLITFLVTLVFPASILFRTESFDDVQDMLLLEQQKQQAVRTWQNETAALGEDPSRLADPTRHFNLSEVIEARAQFDYIYREFTRRPNPPVLTKYKTRLMRELLAMTKYRQSTKLKTALHASCNYINEIEDSPDVTAFQCADTSHKCPDGSFQGTSAWTPIEGSRVTWDDVVIVLMVGAGREPFLEALSETWMRRIGEDATILISRDQGQPALPAALRARRNVVVYDYDGPQGLDQLDVKALGTWRYIHNRYVKTCKKYFLKIDDDSYLIGHNLLRFLMKVDRWFAAHEEPLYFGHPFCGHGDLAALGYARWCYAGGGAYGLNIEAIGMLVRQILGGCAYFYDYVVKAPDWRPAPDKYGGRYEDVMVGRCLRQAKNRQQLNGTSLLACGSFLPYAPLHYYERFGNDTSVLEKKIGDSAITLHNLTPSAIRYLDDFLFEFPIGGPFGPFSTQNPRVDELVRICHMHGKKMVCDWPTPGLSSSAT